MELMTRVSCVPDSSLVFFAFLRILATGRAHLQMPGRIVTSTWCQSNELWSEGRGGQDGEKGLESWPEGKTHQSKGIKRNGRGGRADTKEAAWSQGTVSDRHND